MDVDHTNGHNLRKSTETTSIHGVRQLSLTYHHSKFVLAAWILTICVAFVTICYQITTLTRLILTFPSTIGVSISLEHTVFPTVTACNMGVYKKSVVENIDTFAQMSQALTSVASGQRSKREAGKNSQVDHVGSGEEIRQKRQSPSCTTGCVMRDSFCFLSVSTLYVHSAAQAMCIAAGGKLPFFATIADWTTFARYHNETRNYGSSAYLGFWNYDFHNSTLPGVWRDANGTGTAVIFSDWSVAGKQPSEHYSCADSYMNKWWAVSCSETQWAICMCLCLGPVVTIANGVATSPPTVPSLPYTTAFVCNLGYMLVGSASIQCLSGAVWSGSPPTCVLPTTTTTTTTTTRTTTTATIAAAAQIPAVSAAQFVAILTTSTNGTTDTIAAASQLNSAMEIVTSSLTGAALQELGFKKSDFITACLFSGIPCNNEEKLTLVQIPEFLNCYAFNHRDQHSLLTSDRSGEKFGLSMAFNIHSEEYLNTMSVAGVQLFVQEQIDPILPGSMGRVYSPGLLYYLSISKRIENQLSLPGRKCITSPMEIPFNLFKNDTYYTESCLRSYLQTNIIKTCGCGSTKYPLPNDNSKFCDLTTAKCASDYLTLNGAKLIEEAQKACPPACQSLSFDLTTTFARLSPQLSLLENLNMTRSTYMNNIVMVKLFFAKDTVMVYTEELNLGVVSIFANLGGSLGCVAGLSVISIVEMIYMIANGVAVMKKKCH